MSSNKPNDEWGNFFEGVTGQSQTPSPTQQPQPNAGTPPISPPQTTVTCRHCGATNDASQKFCGSCGAPLQQAPPANTSAAPHAQPGQIVYVQSSPINPTLTKSKSNALLIEAIGAFFAIYGLGWLYAGQSDVGIKRLVLGIIWGVIALTISFVTVGIGACIVLPLNIVFLMFSVNSLNDFTKANPQLFHA